MTPLAEYLHHVRTIYNTGTAVAETAYYGALEHLLNEVGKAVKPHVRCILHPGNKGAGLPDGGLFTSDQFTRKEDEDTRKKKMLLGQVPSRGVIEAKGVQEKLDEIATSSQVAKYLERYGQVLITNYREFLLVVRDPVNGSMQHRERFSLANSASEFWASAAKASETDTVHGALFCEFLKRVMQYGAPLSAPSDVAWFLASYARDARIRIENVDLPALTQVRSALETALGISFKGKKGDHFFKSTLVQTLFYGIFSAWVLWHRKHKNDNDAQFNWQTAMYELQVPAIQVLFEQVALPSRLNSLKLVEVLNWTGDVLNRVNRNAFFSKFDDQEESGTAVQYFYEPFLEQFDPELRKQLGVWYTPIEVVRYQVERVDRVLRDELGIKRGLADDRVYVLDPCCGTGAYLVEVIKRIHRTLNAEESEDDALGTGGDLKKAVTSRIFGFEILPAPYVVAHLQIGILLQNLGVQLFDASKTDEKNSKREENKERVGVFLTNALTGWDPPQEGKPSLPYTELEDERDAAEDVKREKPILVILGNPPYNAKPKEGDVDVLYSAAEKASPSVDTSVYKKDLNKPEKDGGWGIMRFSIDDLYLRFFRLAEKRITGRTEPGIGVVCYISNASYVADPSYVVVRQHMLDGFDSIWIDNLNGDSRETGKKTPLGEPDPSVFSTDYNKVGIRVGTAVSIMVRKEKRASKPVVKYREYWGATKRTDLLKSLDEPHFDAQYSLALPTRDNRFSFYKPGVTEEYKSWPSVADLCSIDPLNGPIERRGNGLIVFGSDKNDLEKAVQDYLDPTVSHNDVLNASPLLMRSKGEFKAEKTRDGLKGKIPFDSVNIVRYPFKPLDIRLAYLDPKIQPLFSRPSPELLRQRFSGNKFVVVRETGDVNPNSPPFLFSPLVCDYHSMQFEAKHIPIRILPRPSSKAVKRAKKAVGELFVDEEAVNATTPAANLSDAARAYLLQLGVKNVDADYDTASILWMHALAIGYSPAYLNQNMEGIRRNWPRLPMPDDLQALKISAALGLKIATFLNTETEVECVTTKVGNGLAVIGIISREGGGKLNRETGEFALEANWGSPTPLGVMPGQGDARLRAFTPDERQAIADAYGEEALSLLVAGTRDIYLNDVAYWRNVPEAVWKYTIGGYQVLKKWLSYRDKKVIGRDLTDDDMREARNIIRRIAAVVMLTPDLDANYQSIRESAFVWSPGR
ncbi:MAG: adenine specific methyltransferase [Chthonomonadaceae bacterium]|nr:adenine specific methyltransferase [Chthonomonadaceae bacterium]